MEASSRQIGSCDNLFNVNVVITVCILENRSNRTVTTSYRNRAHRIGFIQVCNKPAEFIHIVFFKVEIKRKAVFHSENFVVLNVAEYEFFIILRELFTFVVFKRLNNNLNRFVIIGSPVFDFLFFDIDPVWLILPIGVNLIL